MARSKFVTFSPALRKELVGFFSWLASEIPNEDAYIVAMKRIGVKYGVSVADMEEAYWTVCLAMEGGEVAILFYSDQKWLSGDPCFDVRYDAQILPKGSVVVGMVDRKGNAVFHLPAMNSEQEADFGRIFAEAIGYMGLPEATWEDGQFTPGPTFQSLIA